MAQVTLRINGYAYVIGCQDGEEKHLEAMAAEVNRRIDGVRLASGPSGESRMLVMAALLMADDLFELRGRLETATANAAAAATAAAAANANTAEPRPDPRLGRKLSRMAKRAEEIADGLEHP